MQSIAKTQTESIKKALNTTQMNVGIKQTSVSNTITKDGKPKNPYMNKKYSPGQHIKSIYTQVAKDSDNQSIVCTLIQFYLRNQ